MIVNLESSEVMGSECALILIKFFLQSATLILFLNTVEKNISGLSEEVQTNLSDIELYRIYYIVYLLLENHCVTSKLAFCNYKK